MKDLAALIRTIPDYPKPGIRFRDVTTLLGNGDAFRQVIDRLAARYAAERVAKVAGIESRGFILGAPLAYALGAGFVPVRKAGKLPAATFGVDYALEYGRDRLEMHVDAVTAGQRVLVVDDLIATGGTAAATVQLLRRIGAEVVETAVVIELPELDGRARLTRLSVPLFALVSFEGH